MYETHYFLRDFGADRRVGDDYEIILFATPHADHECSQFNFVVTRANGASGCVTGLSRRQLQFN